jgi:hypothetical protein
MHHCSKQDLEYCAVWLEYKFSDVYVPAVYRTLTDDIELFSNKLEDKFSCKLKAEFVICGDKYWISYWKLPQTMSKFTTNIF